MGRAMLANFMIYSVPRYWVQTMAAPEWFQKYLQADIYELFWEREPKCDVKDIGTNSKAYKCLKHHDCPITPRGNTSLEIGLIDWRSHVKAMQVKWLLKYLDASKSSWKIILDCWLARSLLGRAAILSSYKAKELVLVQSMRGNIALPLFWRQALDALKELDLTPHKDSAINRRCSFPANMGQSSLPPSSHTQAIQRQMGIVTGYSDTQYVFRSRRQGSV
jgi:hypothetical protein